MLVLFDLDDTLLDDTGATRVATSLLHKRLASPLPLESFVAHWSKALEDHFPRYLAGEITFQEQRRKRVRQVISASISDHEADRLFDEYHSDYQAAWSLFPDVLPCLGEISHLRLGVVTNGNGEQQRRKLKHAGLVERFQCIVVSDECGTAKPSPEIFLHACSLVGERPSSAIYVGDKYETDAVAARRAGLRGVWLDRKNKGTSDHLPPKIGSLSEVRGLAS